MLILLTVFSILVFGLYNTGITHAPDESDPEWTDQGGDAAVAPMAELPKLKAAPQEQPGLGGGAFREPSGTSIPTQPQK